MSVGLSNLWSSPVSTHWQVQELRCIPSSFLSFCGSCSFENILMVLFQNLVGGPYLCPAFHDPLCSGWCHLLHGQLLVSLISLHFSLPSSTHITGRDWLYLRMQSCLLLLITHQQHLLECLSTQPCLFHCGAGSTCMRLMHVPIRTSVCAVLFAWNTYHDNFYF